ncbi:MAG TPA: hypothetical protein VKU85_02785 [bacterium]|nr:hypothetical protein [bacterium]
MTDRGNADGSGRTALIAALAAVVGGAALRLALLPWMAYDGDDFWTLKWTARPLPELLSSYRTGLTMHLYLAGMKGWMALFGTAPAVVKLPTVLAGIALLPLTFFLGRRWTGAAPAAAAVVLAALSGPLVANAMMARVYPILAVVILLSMRELLDWLDRPSRRGLIRLALLDALALALSLNATVVVMVQGAVLLMEAARDPRLRGRTFLQGVAAFAAAGALAAVFYAAALPDILRTSDAATGSHFHLGSLTGGFALNHPAAPAAAFGLLAIGAWTLRGSRAGRLLLVWAVLPGLFYFLQRMRYPEWAIARYLVVHLPAQLLLIGAGLWATVRFALPRAGTPARLAIAAALPLAAVAFSPAARGELLKAPRPSGAALARIAETVRPGDAVTYDFLPYKFLFELEPDVPAAGLPELVRGEGDRPEGRLIVLTFAEPLAKGTWSAEFEVEEIGGDRYRESLYVLVSRTAEGGVRPHRAGLRVFCEGLVGAAAAGARLGLTPARHFARLEEAHGFLAELAEQAGDSGEAARHRQLRDEYRERAAREWEKVV